MRSERLQFLGRKRRHIDRMADHAIDEKFGGLLRDVDRLLMEETGLPVIVADDPLTCVVRGCGKALENMEKLSGIFTSD